MKWEQVINLRLTSQRHSAEWLSAIYYQAINIIWSFRHEKKNHNVPRAFSITLKLIGKTFLGLKERFYRSDWICLGINRSIIEDAKIFHRTVGKLQTNWTKLTICEWLYPVMILSESSAWQPEDI